MEDEECLPENSSLHIYLQKLGYSGFQLIKNFSSKTNSKSLVKSKAMSEGMDAEPLDEEVIEKIQIIASTQALFQEDIKYVEKLLSRFKIVKNGLLKNMFQGFSGIIIFFFCLCLYWIIGNYAFVIVSSCYAYKAADYLWRKHYDQVRLKKLVSVMEADHLLLKKVMTFIDENNRIIEINKRNAKCLCNPSTERFEYYKDFKTEVFGLVLDIIGIFCRSTQMLIKQMPLYDHIENPQHYMCNKYHKFGDMVQDLSKLSRIYSLIQSEFLLRLILSLIPNIKLTPKNNFQDLNKIIAEAYKDLLIMKNKLNRKFRVIYLKGVACAKHTKIEFNVPDKTKTNTNMYVEKFISNIHHTSNIFQNLLIKSRRLEESMRNEMAMESIVDVLVNMQKDLNFCQKNIENSFVLLKRANPVPDTCNVAQLKEEVEKSDEDVKKVVVGYTDLDPEIEDEIFEACFSNENLDKDLSNLDDWDFEDSMRKKLEKEYSKKVIEELKIKLVDRAKSREKREASLLKKNYGISLEESTENVKNEDDEEDVKNKIQEQLEENVSEMVLNSDKKNMLHLTEQFEKNSQNFRAHSSNDEYQNDLKNEIYVPKKEFENETEVNTDIERVQNFPEKGNAQFLNDLKAARQTILNSDLAEEEFSCDPDEDFE